MVTVVAPAEYPAPLFVTITEVTIFPAPTTANAVAPTPSPVTITSPETNNAYWFYLGNNPDYGGNAYPFGKDCEIELFGKRIQPSETAGLWAASGLTKMGFYGLAGRTLQEWFRMESTQGRKPLRQFQRGLSFLNKLVHTVDLDQTLLHMLATQIQLRTNP